MVDRTYDSKPPSMDQQSYTATVKKLRNRAARMQEVVDGRGLIDIDNLSITSAAEAMEAVDTYNRDWFRKCLWSRSIQAKFARALIEAVQIYPFIDTTLWGMIVKRAAK